MELTINALRSSILITGLVTVMMLMIEYIHIYSRGRSFARLQNRPMRQIGLAALLGIIPGCIGGFAAVSLYSHGIISFGALIAMMITTLGEEAFFLFAVAPKAGLLLVAILFPLALLFGWIFDKWIKKTSVPFAIEKHYPLHHEDECHEKQHAAIWSNWRENLRNIHPIRALLLTGLFLFILAMSLGSLECDHHTAEAMESCPSHLHLFNERWLNLLFAALSVITFVSTAMANNHFIEEHLWGHIIKKHLPGIFLWTFGALLCITIGIQYLHFDTWVEQNGYIVLLLAALIGLIPESGPHLVFIALFASGAAPFSVLFTSSFVQDGHTTLPLLAENKSAFFKTKAIKLTLGIAIGSALYFCGI